MNVKGKIMYLKNGFTLQHIVGTWEKKTNDKKNLKEKLAKASQWEKSGTVATAAAIAIAVLEVASASVAYIKTKRII